MSGRRAAALLLVALACPAAHAAPPVAEIAARLGLPEDVVAAVARGTLAQWAPREASDRELAVGFAFLTPAAPDVARARFLAASDVHDDPTWTATPIAGAADFGSLRLRPDGAAEAARYAEATPGDALNLSDAEIAAFRGLGPDTDAVEARLRLLLADRLAAYRRGGLAAITPYARADGVQRRAGDELRAAAEASTLVAYDPAFRAVVLDWPATRPDALAERVVWLAQVRDDRPDFALRHRMTLPVADGVLVCDRELYVSHGYNAAQTIAAFLAVDAGTLVVLDVRTSTDRAAGFGASARHAIGRRLMASELAPIFGRARATIAR